MAKAKQAELSTLFAALADPTRLRLLNLMRGRELCVCFFVAILEQSQPKISRHLAYLRRAGVVSARREGKWMHYQIVTPEDAASKDVLEVALKALGKDSRLNADRAKLDKACCSPAGLVGVAGAPVPEKTLRSR